MKQSIEKWTKLEVSKCPPFILDRLSETTVRQQVNSEVQTHLNNIHDEAFAQSNFEYCSIPKSKMEDYKYRTIATELGEMITSIRFISGDLTKPVVFIVLKDFEFKTISEINATAKTLYKEYALFEPERIRWHSSKLEHALIEEHDHINGDMVHVSEFIDHLKNQPLPKNYDRVNLSLAQSIHWYDHYKNDFDEIVKAWPAFDEMGRVEDQETLNRLLKQEMLYEIQVDNTWAGLIAVDKKADSLLEGYVIMEEFLLKPFRGKHFASAVQRHLIEKLTANKDEMLFGTIHYHNTPSLKTALKVGRKPVGMFVLASILEKG